MVPNESKKKCEKRVPYFIPCHRNECVAQARKFREGIFVKILRASETFSARPAGHKTTVLLRPADSALGPGRRDPRPVNSVLMVPVLGRMESERFPGPRTAGRSSSLLGEARAETAGTGVDG